jgi:hypothetical protein
MEIMFKLITFYYDVMLNYYLYQKFKLIKIIYLIFNKQSYSYCGRLGSILFQIFSLISRGN